MTGDSNPDSSDRRRLSAAQRDVIARRVRRALELTAPGEADSKLTIPALDWPEDRSLSFAQEGLYYLHRLTGGNPALNRPFAMRLKGSLNRDALAWALEEISAHHDILRSIFVVEGGEPICRLSPTATEPLSIDDLTRLPESSRAEEARRMVEAEARKRFDLQSGPIRRFGLIRLGNEDHVLWGCVHHIAFDAWSEAIFRRELAGLYAARTGAAALTVHRPPIQYADYAAWQRETLPGPVLETNLEYWVRQLGGLPENLLNLSYDSRSMDSEREANGERLKFALPSDLVERLRVFATSEGATPFMALLAVYAAVLGREFGLDDIPIGAPVAGRRLSELERLIGLFVNMLIFRCDVSGEPSFRELVRRTAPLVQTALEHQDMPFDLLVRRLQPQRKPGQTPLFQVAFNYRAIPSRPIVHSLAESLPFDFDPGSAQYALDLEFTPRSRELDAVLIYRPSIFDRRQIEAFIAEYQQLLAYALDHPDWPLIRRKQTSARSPVWKDADDHRPGRAFIYDRQTTWNRTRRAYPRERGVVEIFREVAAAHPEAPALEYGDGHLSYAELDAQSERMAVWLRRMGVGREAPVGLRMERSAGMVTAMLAVLKAGGAYLPLDPGYPEERLAYMIADGGVKVIVTRGEWEGPAGVQVVELEAEEAENGAEAPWTEGIDVAGGGERLAYIMYTSGSTGRPKGIEIPQRGIVRLVKNSDYLQVQPGERVAQGSTMSFDAATLEVWNALLNGGTLVGLEPDVLLNPARLGEALRERRVDHLFLTTALFNQTALAAPEIFAGLKTVMFGGEVANPEAARRVLAAGRPQRLINLYGPTETTVVGTWYEIKTVLPEARSLPIGLPIANTTAYVLDESLRTVSPGKEGELYLGGDGLARGYLNRPGLTAERFIPNPFETGSLVGETRLYRTGDRVRRAEDGMLEYVGRVDSQVKLRGFRIEPEEIEAALLEHPKVAAAAVGLQNRGDVKRLAAYIVWKGAHADSEQDVFETNGDDWVLGSDRSTITVRLREHLRSRLPEYMIPAGWYFLDQLPLYPSGKLDRTALERLEVEETIADDRRLPQTALEKVLAGLWAEALGVTDVRLEDSFFELGGHSLMAIRVMSRVQDLLQVEAPLSLFYDTATLEAFSCGLIRLAQAKDPPLDLDRIAGLILKLASLSDAEVATMLAQKGPGSGTSRP